MKAKNLKQLEFSINEAIKQLKVDGFAVTDIDFNRDLLSDTYLIVSVKISISPL